MADPDDTRETQSIASALSECLILYRHLYLSLTGHDCQIAEQVDVTKISDNYGRLNIWSSDSGALRVGRGSLDDTLRTNENLRAIVLDTISDLKESLQRATRLADVGTNEHHLVEDDSDGESLSSDSTAPEPVPDEGARSRSKKGKIHYVVSDIFVHIQSLYKISVSLRRPAVQDKYIRSVSKDANASCYIPWDRDHVKHKFPNAGEVLVRRLALGNTRRREQLNYWQQHPQDSAEGFVPEAVLFDTEISQPSPSATSQQKLAFRKPATGSNPTRSLDVPSRTTKQSFSTVAQSVINDNETFSGRPRTVYEPSLQGAGHRPRVPEIPAVPFGQTSFGCPYCRAKLNVQTMRKRHLWKKHVFRDLRPYMCTYEGCLNAEKLYVTRHDWMYHEGQLHQRSWICGNQCNCKFSSPQVLKQHILDRHPGTFTESQLPILLDMCERPADLDERASCILCGEEATLRALQNHVASHLEDLALFVLPVETDDYNADANSDHAKRSCEKGNRLEEDELSSLGSFSEDEADEAPLQDPKEFQTALKTWVEHSLPKVGDWLNVDRESRAEEEERQDTVQSTPFPRDSGTANKRARTQDSPTTSPPATPVLKAVKIEGENIDEENIKNKAYQVDFIIPDFLDQSRSAIRAKFYDLAWKEKLRILQGRSDPSSPWVQDTSPHVAKHNRYANVQPWNKSRIHLKVTEGTSDYINASPISLRDLRTGIETRFIATQGPKQSTLSHFWHMVWQETSDVAVIIMLTQTHDGTHEKCFQYFPLDTEVSFKIDPLEGARHTPGTHVPEKRSSDRHSPESHTPENSVTLLEYYPEMYSKTQVRKLVLNFGAETKDVWHFFFTAWPDFATPEDEDRTALLRLLRLYTEKNSSSGNPRIIHDSAGVGRSGTFIALEYLLAQVDSGAILDVQKGEDMVFDVVDRLREQRMLMVQTEGQYQFLYDVVRDELLQKLHTAAYRDPHHPTEEEDRGTNMSRGSSPGK